MQEQYTPKAIEQEAQTFWADNESFVANVDTQKRQILLSGHVPLPQR